MGKWGPCFSRMPKGKTHVPWARLIAAMKSAPVSSSQWTDSLACGEPVCAGAGRAGVKTAQRSRKTDIERLLLSRERAMGAPSSADSSMQTRVPVSVQRLLLWRFKGDLKQMSRHRGRGGHGSRVRALYPFDLSIFQ